MRTVLTGLTFGESVRWHQDRVWFCDWVQGEVVASTPDGQREVMARVDGMPFCIDWLPSGELVITGQPKLLRQREGELETYAELGHITTYPWNEVAVHASGNAYANSINFDFATGGEYQPGLIALVRPDGTAETVADDIAFPNGMAVSPDNATLIVADSYRHQLVAFDIGADGGLSNRRVWAELGEGTPDGICVDAQNAVWYADVPNHRCVRVIEGGEVLEIVELDRGCFACALGGPDGTTLFVVAAEWRGMTEPEPVSPGTGQVLTIQVDVPGASWP
jgi:sugar lactone lactonase YvrE